MMFDQSGAMGAEEKSPEFKARGDAILKEFRENIQEEPLEFKKHGDKFDKMSEEAFSERFPARPLQERFNDSIDIKKFKKFFNNYDLLDFKLTPEERAAKARERGEALASA